jgi:signal transduction histidine kinase
VSEVLDLSKVEAGQMQVEAVTFAVEPMLRELAQTVRPLVDRRGNALELDIADDVGSLVSDPLRVRQVLDNLLSNAAKFTENGTIRLSASVEPDDRLVFVVEDTGIGMSEQTLARVFRPFVQADTSTSRRYGGTGLGLTLCRRLVELLQGDLEARSNVDQVSRFTVVLPRCPVPRSERARPRSYMMPGVCLSVA